MAKGVVVASTKDLLTLGGRMIALLDSGLSQERVQQLLNQPGLLERFMKDLGDAPKNQWPLFRISVDYRQTLDQMIAACGLNWSDSNFKHENFSHDLRRRGSWDGDVVLVGPYDRGMESAEVEADLATQGLRPAEVVHAPALIKGYPEVAKGGPIVFLDSRWRYPDGDVYVPVLGEIGGKRELYLSWYEVQWGQDCRFAAVAK